MKFEIWSKTQAEVRILKERSNKAFMSQSEYTTKILEHINIHGVKSLNMSLLAKVMRLIKDYLNLEYVKEHMCIGPW